MEQVFSVFCDSDRLNLPSVLVLNSCGITCAGDEREIAAFCAHVSELDLSDNKLEDWHEVQAVRCRAGERRWVPCAPAVLLLCSLAYSDSGSHWSLTCPLCVTSSEC